MLEGKLIIIPARTVFMYRQRMKDLLLRARVVVKTSNMKISRRHLPDYVKTLHPKACCTCSTNIFLHSTNQIIDCGVVDDVAVVKSKRNFIHQWRERQRQRHKLRIWLVERVKISVLHALMNKSVPSSAKKQQRETTSFTVLMTTWA